MPPTLTMPPYRKVFKGVDPSYVRNEAELQMVAAKFGLSPKVLGTDYKTFIEMEEIENMNVGDWYGEDIKDIPPHILSAMWSLVWMLYHVCGIAYIDVWPRNFVEKNGRVWIIDFGDAYELRYTDSEEPDHYLDEILKAGKITHWNPEFL